MNPKYIYIIGIVTIISVLILFFVGINNAYESGYQFGKTIGEQDGVNYAIRLLTGEMCINNKTFLCNNNQTICGCANIGVNQSAMQSGI